MSSVAQVRAVRRKRARLAGASAELAPAVEGAPNPAAGEVALTSRTRLFALLDKAIASPATLISAPAGTGKTALVVSWLRYAAHPVAWVPAPDRRGDRDPVRLLRAVGRALTATSAIPPRERAAIVRARHSERALLAALTHAADALPAITVLAVDGLASTNPDDRALAALTVLLRRCPRLRLVACTRTRAAAGLSRARLDGDLVELDPSDLAFTPEEADDLLRLNGVALPPDVLASLVDRMDGWATGLCLAAREAIVAADPVSTVDAFDADRPTTVDYFRSEVMGSLDRDDRALLLRASVAPTVTPALADAILESTRGARALDRLCRAHLVECVDGAHYRVPPVFLRYLRHEAMLEVPADVRERDRSLAEDCPKATVQTGLIEPISGREAVVLALLPSLLNAREIAEQLFVSPNTVKTQLKSVYRKLGVQTRRAAVERARHLGLL